MIETTLYYFHDPMCSWCYAFQPAWEKIKTGLPEEVKVENIVGGLAPDDENPMPERIRNYIQGCWHRIEEVVPGTVFNFNYWSECEPRRSTYPACRAVIAAKIQGREYEEPMIHAIQEAYYRNAQNPSDYETHLQLACELKLDVPKFEKDLFSREIDEELERQIDFSGKLGIPGFPCLVLNREGEYIQVPHDYNDPCPTLDAIDSVRP
ncbi:MAG: DsbA family protein [Gammaproteobacteria bacterium]